MTRIIYEDGNEEIAYDIYNFLKNRYGEIKELKLEKIIPEESGSYVVTVRVIFADGSKSIMTLSYEVVINIRLNTNLPEPKPLEIVNHLAPELNDRIEEGILALLQGKAVDRVVIEAIEWHADTLTKHVKAKVYFLEKRTAETIGLTLEG